ncbi:hypothetical protein Hanom_Chr16g01511711 [Helianthus anomalus]
MSFAHLLKGIGWCFNRPKERGFIRGAAVAPQSRFNSLPTLTVCSCYCLPSLTYLIFAISSNLIFVMSFRC